MSIGLKDGTTPSNLQFTTIEGEFFNENQKEMLKIEKLKEAVRAVLTFVLFLSASCYLNIR